MLDKITYVNHKGEAIHFGEWPFFANSNNLRDYDWSFDKTYGLEFYKEQYTTKKLSVVVMDRTRLNWLFETFETDLISKIPGKLYIGDYYTDCYITKSEKTDYLTAGYASLTFEVTMKNDSWIKNRTYKGKYQNQEVNYWRGYKKGYPYGYNSSLKEISFKLSEVANNSFLLRVYGKAINPSIRINNHLYQVFVTVQDYERLEIDSKSKTIEIIRIDGKRLNVFNLRNKESNIFHQLNKGQNAVTWDGDFTFDLITLEERSEPEWN